MKTIVFVLGCAYASVALAAPPPAPHITVASTDIKQLEFTITPVTQVNRYELWFKANAGAAWVKYTETPAQRPLIRISVSVHLLDWPQARYTVKACNPSGCSTSNEVGVNSEKLIAMGYFKPNTPGTGALYFGGKVAASADGKTIAVLGNETVGSTQNAGVVYVYRKTTSTGGWRREARLLTSRLTPTGGQFYLGDPLAISGDGNLIAFGSWVETLPGAPNQNNGAVYLFRRSGSTWTESQKIPGDPSGYGDYFGEMVKLDDAGRTLVISHDNAGGTTFEDGRLEVYRDPGDGSNQFAHTATLPVPANVNPDAQMYCDSMTLSGDGQSLFRGCYSALYPYSYERFYQLLKAPNWVETARLPPHTLDGIDVSYDARQVLIQEGNYGIAYVLGPNGYVVEAALTDFGGDSYGPYRHIAISRDGKIAAIGNPSDVAAGLGPIFPPYQTADHPSGGVVIHERRSTGWVIRRAIKPGSTNEQWFGHTVALGDNGRVLVVGAPLDNSAATGIDGDRDDTSVPNRGAAWIY